MKHQFVVNVELPDNVTPAYMASYIREAIKLWCKQLSPDDLLFDLKATVKSVGVVGRRNDRGIQVRKIRGNPSSDRKKL